MNNVSTAYSEAITMKKSNMRRDSLQANNPQKNGFVLQVTDYKQDEKLIKE